MIEYIFEIDHDWTSEERARFERLYCAFLQNDNKAHHIEAVKWSYNRLIALNKFYTLTQTTDNE